MAIVVRLFRGLFVFSAVTRETTVHLTLGKISTIIGHFKRTDLLKKNQTGLIEATFLQNSHCSSKLVVLFLFGGKGICEGKSA